MQTLAEIEAIVLSPDTPFDEKGRALAHIFKECPPNNYETYCLERLGFTYERARQFINAARVVDMLRSSPTTTAVGGTTP